MFFELSVSVTVGLQHIEFADPGVVVNEDVSFGFNISDGLMVRPLWDVASLGELVSGVLFKTLDNFPHVRTV